MHVIAAKTVSLGEALTEEFKTYVQAIITGAKRLAKTLQSEGVDIVFSGTDNHLLLLDLHSLGVTGKVAEVRDRVSSLTSPFPLYQRC